MLSNHHHDQSDKEIEKIDSQFYWAIQDEPRLSHNASKSEIALYQEKLSEYLIKIEGLLRAGANPDRGISVLLKNKRLTDKLKDYGTQSGSGDYQSDYGSTDITIYPLHKVEGREIIHLLLKYGANPDSLPYSGDLHPEEHWLTPIEQAVRDKNYAKVRRLASFSPCTIRTDLLNNAIKSIIQHADITNELELEAAKRAVNLLMLKSGDRKGTLKEVQNKIAEHSANARFQAVYAKNIERQKIINTMASVWILLNQGHNQEESVLSKFPFEILLKLMSHIAPKSSNTSPDIYEFITEDSSVIQKNKVSAFRKIYSIMKAGDTLNPHGFLDEENNKNISPVRFIRNIQNKIHEYPLGCMTTTAWRWANLYYENPNPATNNDLMRRFVKWYISKDTTLSLISFFSEKGRQERVENIVKSIADKYESLSSSSSENDEANKIIPKYKIRG